MTIDIAVMIAVCGFALSVGPFFVGRMTAAKTDGQKYHEKEMKRNVRKNP